MLTRLFFSLACTVTTTRHFFTVVVEPEWVILKRDKFSEFLLELRFYPTHYQKSIFLSSVQEAKSQFVLLKEFAVN